MLLDNDSALALVCRGIVFANLNETDKALLDFNRAIDLQPTYSYAYFNRGILKYSIKDTSGACIDWNQAVRFGYSAANEKIIMNCK